MMSSETIASPPPPRSPQQQQDDESLYGPVTKAASKEAEREEIRKAEQRQHAYSPLNIKERMRIEAAQVLAAAAASPQRQHSKQKKKRPVMSVGNSQQPPSSSTSSQDMKMSVAAHTRAADAKNNNTKNQNNNTQKPPMSGNRGIVRGKYTPAQAKQLADAWGRDDTSEEYDYEDDDSYYDYEEGEEDNDNAAEEEMFHYQHHRVSAYSNRYGRGHGRSPPRSGNDNRGNNDNSNTQASGGIFSLASNWLQNQRDKLHQLELERQVEEQRRKLLEEGRKQRELEAEKRRDRGYAISSHGPPTRGVDNSTVASSAITGDEVAASALVYMDGCCNSEEEDPQQLKSVNSSNSSIFICGFGGNYLATVDDASDYSGVARIDSSGNVVEMMPSADLEDDYHEEEEGEYMTVRTPKITVTGKGMSVAVEIPESNSLLDDDHFYVKVVPEPRRDENSIAPFILLQPQMKALLKSGGLPQSLNCCKWKRLYSLSRDGDSFETFLRMVGDHDRTVLVVKTTAGRLFGGYAETRWEARHKNRQADGFYGSAQACLFRFPHCGGNVDLVHEETSSAALSSSDDEVVIYKWTGANRYIQLCDAAKRIVAFGGGGDDGDFGLCIEDDFRRGTTGHCSTFENEALCEEGYFDVVNLEVWGFTLDF